MTHHQEKTFAYHLVNPSVWPFLSSLSALQLTRGLALYFHQYAGAAALTINGLLCVILSAVFWWKDVYKESFAGDHTSKVKKGLHQGRILFIVTEARFFVGLIWAFLHGALMPTAQIGLVWPPVGIVPVDWTHLPTVNTLILALSYFFANAARHSIYVNDSKKAFRNVLCTIVCGLVFVYCQYLEYTEALFTRTDARFGSAFYLSTGFHGFHVRIGILYLTVCLFTLNSRNAKSCTALELAVLYWHFVDIVWIFIFILVYVWGGATSGTTINTAHDGQSARLNLLF